MVLTYLTLFIIGHFTRLQTDALTDWPDTASWEAGIPAPVPCQAVRCKSVFLHNEDRAYVSGFVLFRRGVQETDQVIIGQIFEIIARADTGAIVGVLIGEATIQEMVLPYRFRSIRPPLNPTCFLQLQVRLPFLFEMFA